MARRSRSTGVGRGNGPGSAKSQYKDGMPSGNPAGRPRRPKVRPPATLVESLQQALGAPTKVIADGKETEMPLHQALVKDMLNGFPRWPVSQKLSLMRFLVEHMPEVLEAPAREPTQATAEAIVAVLAERARQRQAAEEERKAWGTRQ